MSKWIKRVALGLVALVVLGGALAFTALKMADSKMNRKVDVKVQPLAFRSDAPAVERGKYLYASRGCTDCHGADGGGRVFVENPQLKVAGPHISPGPGSVTAAYKPEDWVRDIRHGVAPTGRPLMVMPSEDYNRFTDEDLSSLVAYLRQMPAAKGGGAVVELGPIVRAMYGLGKIQDAAAKIDHTLPPASPVAEGVTVEHGKYVANMCLGCHGPALAGGPIPGGPPDWPAAAKLTPGEGSIMPKYPTADSMVAMFKSGKRPDGTEIKVMPFGSLKEMSETDVRALYLYLKGLK